MYTEEQIEKMRVQAHEAECTGPYLFWAAPASELTKVCNGVGSESMPEWSRDVLTFIYRNYAPAAAIHDCRYEESDGIEDNRRDADDEFFDNAMRLWKKKYGLARFVCPAAYAGKAKIKAAYVILDHFGMSAWQEAYERRLKAEGTEGADGAKGMDGADGNGEADCSREAEGNGNANERF